MNTFVISYDIGTTGVKTCIFEISTEIKLIASAMEGYELIVFENGGVEQNPRDWWQSMCNTTKTALKEAGISPDKIKGVSFCAQMQGLVLTDVHGTPLRMAMSYMDSRAKDQLSSTMGKGIRISGINAIKLIRSLKTTGAVAASVKDPVYKYKWVKENEPDIYENIYKWLDVKDYLILNCTGEFIMTEDSAFATLLYNPAKGRKCFDKELCKMFGVNIEHLPRIIKSTDIAGRITEAAAKQLGLPIGTPVFGGGGDASLIGVGAGAVEKESTHIYLGTSGWVSTVVDNQVLDINNMIASIVGAETNLYNYFAELETAGKCLEWVKDHLALDEIDIYIEKKQIDEGRESLYKSLYEYMMEAIKDIPSGSNGVIFTPWLHGNRCPFEDSNVRGMFFNISLATGKTELIHAVLEGICYHLRWQLEASEEKVKTSGSIRFVGGGALAPLTCQLLADILGRKIQTVENPQNAGAVGAAILAAVGLGIVENINDASKLIKIKAEYIPKAQNKTIYDKYFGVFKALYKSNKKSYSTLNYKNDTLSLTSC